MAEALKRLLRLHPREHRLALIAGGLIGCWVVVSWLVQPLWDRAGALRTQINTQQQKLDAINRLLAQAPAIEQEYQRWAPYLGSGDDEQARSSFLNELEALSRESSVQMNLKPRAPRQAERMSRFEVELDVEGSQEQLLAFLDGLLGLRRLMTIDRLRISSVPLKDNWLRANLVIQKLTVRP